MRLQLIALFACVLCFAACSEDALRGRVVKVADGDTITILDASNTQYKIRLQGIDAPEKAQAFGRASGRYLSGLVAGRDVRVTYAKRDQYDRILGIVYLDDRDINLEMLKAGMAWHYKKYDSTPAYAKAEAEARAAKLGLWVEQNPIEPHEYRKAKGHGALVPLNTGRVLKIYGGEGQKVFLGELNTSQSNVNSIWNEFGTYGNSLSLVSIWNELGTYGSDLSQCSPFNEFASNPPVILDGAGNFYGYLTVNEIRPNRAEFKLALFLYKHYKSIREDVGKWGGRLGF